MILHQSDMSMKRATILLGLGVMMTGSMAFSQSAAPKIGYSDTPVLPGQKWKVHDGGRPQPNIVTPGGTFSHMAPAPADATVLFDGTDLSQWIGESGNPAGWKVENGYMEVTRSGGIRTREEFGDFQMHLEFATPAEVSGNSQGRGNSGVIIYGKFEIQVLDSYENPTYPDGQAGAMYGQFPPRVNASKKPGEWQTYDIIFEAPRFDDNGKLTKKANVTVIHNGVLLHHRQEFMGHVSHRNLPSYGRKYDPKGSIHLQDHGNPIRYRNIWIRPLDSYDE